MTSGATPKVDKTPESVANVLPPHLSGSEPPHKKAS
jgi:hypothetical protein